MTYAQSLKYLDDLNVFGIKPGLERITLLAEKLSQPQNFFSSVHVAGTNGKGSTSAMLAEIFKQAGLKVGLFTSPHLESYCERIKVNGENISETEFAEVIELVKFFDVQATQFEVLTAAAFAYFAKENVDVAVIEVGLGGLFDSTNIITPKISVITNISLEHENILGDLKNIALNKAGIIKKNVPVVTGATDLPLEIIRQVAEKNSASLYEVTEPADVKINLHGEFQKFNAAIAIKTARLFGISDEKIFAGLEKVTWPGRFEILQTDFGEVVIDGAHNPHGAAALRQSLDKNFPAGRRIFIFGALADKNIDAMIEILFRENDFVICCEPNSVRAESVENLRRKLKNFGVESTGAENISAAIAKLKTFGGVKIVCGSLYLIGAARKNILQ